MLKRTPLYDVYKEYGGKTIDFGGWELPVQFSSIKEEHEAVRTKAGLFDVSHMGEVEVSGKDALSFLQKMMTNDVADLKPGNALYTAMCYPDGGTVDDLLIYQKSERCYLLVINASNIEKDIAWLTEHAEGDVTLTNQSDGISLLAVQGPNAQTVLAKLTECDLSSLKPFTFIDEADVAGRQVLLSRTGYTGEDGFELYCRNEDAVHLFKEILAAGEHEGLVPCGLGARDTLRFEAKLALYGQELTKDITPIEAGIGFAVKHKKDSDFFGKSVLREQKEKGAPRKLVGLEMIEKGIPRHGYAVKKDGVPIGEVTTGTQSPTLKKNIGLALIKTEFSEVGTEVEVEIRKKTVKAKVVRTPFYKRPKQN
ncbi:glycine cleavage system aminomethyltransferase GcvT [Bacillus velezensis]|uniref:glycine cleavage system aminomethyltransferase GcvT n=1 Tax=Bacillus TaxID=1386 RepID=UPI0015945685|nr:MULTISPECIES: glycine cleavage system aminomethyltransferase GcvT [Bacillus]MBT0954267.1 glycine cleavage system aminomethyltransferase GcvT [Bacillus velezensis]MCD7911986.1 glycine cleavage system aminomethyltransferase GcvT [Bacillus velezensis]MCQ9192736.1 glycine cleavage system aminomethyltransferase GcvT [Bacillus velezensis]MCX2916927.1 glycine cleavage system aminomethyltransferase GcvT [Bacillus velezensis]MCY6275821.1 glycine cleavage system aminomethyltransferase GcvT [Bacillus 